jgi:hypothetical protein
MTHIPQSRPDSGLGFQVKVVETLQLVPSSLSSGQSFEAPSSGFPDFGFERPRLGFRVSYFGFPGFGILDSGSRFRVPGSGFRVSGVRRTC